MSIDYDRRRQLLDDFDQAETFHAKWAAREAISVSAEEPVRELIRLRDELTDLSDTMHAHAELLRGESRQVAADYAHRLTRILQGDTE